MKYILLFLLFIFNLFSMEGLSFSSLEVKNGETVLVKFTNDEGIVPKKIIYETRHFPFYLVNFSDSEYYALIPISYNEKLGDKNVSLLYEDEGVEKTYYLPSFKVVWGEYKKETLKVDSSKIILSKKDKKRTAREYQEARELYAKRSERFLPMNLLQKPLESVITSAFGNERLFNGVRKSYHSGVDFRAKVGTKVSAMGFGRVVLVADRFYAGLSIVVDHGHGIYTGYYHMRTSHVAVGDIVDENDVIGLSGASGRITGPHLHFAMKIHGVTVNPLQAMELLSELL